MESPGPAPGAIQGLPLRHSLVQPAAAAPSLPLRCGPPAWHGTVQLLQAPAAVVTPGSGNLPASPKPRQLAWDSNASDKGAAVYHWGTGVPRGLANPSLQATDAFWSTAETAPVAGDAARTSAASTSQPCWAAVEKAAASRSKLYRMPALQKEDADMALQISREAVLGCRMGSPRRGRKCVMIIKPDLNEWVDLDQKGSIYRTASVASDEQVCGRLRALEKKRSAVLGTRHGSPTTKLAHLNGTTGLWHGHHGGTLRATRKAASQNERQGLRGSRPEWTGPGRANSCEPTSSSTYQYEINSSRKPHYLHGFSGRTLDKGVWSFSGTHAARLNFPKSCSVEEQGQACPGTVASPSSHNAPLRECLSMDARTPAVWERIIDITKERETRSPRGTSKPSPLAHHRSAGARIGSDKLTQLYYSGDKV